MSATMQEFIKDLGLTATAARVDKNPNMTSETPMDHWRVVLKYKDGGLVPLKMTVYFSMGTGHKGKAPEAADVLDCLASDAAGVENARSFEEWASEYGYDTDSRKAHKTYTLCKREAERLLKFLGPTTYNDLLWETERL